jgi:hypothetical protein
MWDRAGAALKIRIASNHSGRKYKTKGAPAKEPLHKQKRQPAGWRFCFIRYAI